MKKFIFTLLLAAGLALPVAAATAETVSLPEFDITINGTVIDNEEREYPFVFYNDITYFPMTYYDCRFLGLETVWNEQTGLSVEKTDITSVYYPNPPTGESKALTAEAASLPISVNGRSVDNSALDYPLLLINDVTYFPLTWSFAHDEFGWEYSFGENGLVINSDNLIFEKYPLDIPDALNYRGELMDDSRFIAIRQGEVYYLADDGLYSYSPGETEPTLFSGEYKLNGSARLYSEDGDVFYHWAEPSATSAVSRRLTLGLADMGHSSRWTSVEWVSVGGYILENYQNQWSVNFTAAAPSGETVSLAQWDRYNSDYIGNSDDFRYSMSAHAYEGLLYIVGYEAGTDDSLSRGNLYEVKPLTAERRLLVENVYDSLCASGDRIYFFDRDAGMFYLYNITDNTYTPYAEVPDGEEVKELLAALGENIYWSDEDGCLRRSDGNGTGEPLNNGAEIQAVRDSGEYCAFTFRDAPFNCAKTVVYGSEGEVLRLGVEVDELSGHNGEVMFYHDETAAVYRARLRD